MLQMSATDELYPVRGEWVREQEEGGSIEAALEIDIESTASQITRARSVSALSALSAASGPKSPQSPAQKIKQDRSLRESGTLAAIAGVDDDGGALTRASRSLSAPSSLSRAAENAAPAADSGSVGERPERSREMLYDALVRLRCFDFWRLSKIASGDRDDSFVVQQVCISTSLQCDESLWCA